MKYTSSNSEIVNQFQKFYYELLRQKSKALRESEKQEVDEKDLVQTVQTIQTHFKEFFESMQRHLTTAAERTLMKEAQYIMVALADEIFLKLTWKGQSLWKKSLLEAQIFKTQIAGELFFTRLDELFESQDPFQNEISPLYFWALSLGFEGLYENNTPVLQKYKKKLYALFSDMTPSLHDRADQKLMTQCYGFNISHPAAKSLPDGRKWTTCILSILFVYFLITYIVWHHMIFNLYETLEPILQKPTL